MAESHAWPWTACTRRPPDAHSHTQPVYYGNSSTRAPRVADGPYLHQVY